VPINTNYADGHNFRDAREVLIGTSGDKHQVSASSLPSHLPTAVVGKAGRISLRPAIPVRRHHRDRSEQVAVAYQVVRWAPPVVIVVVQAIGILGVSIKSASTLARVRLDWFGPGWLNSSRCDCERNQKSAIAAWCPIVRLPFYSPLVLPRGEQRNYYLPNNL